MNAPTPSPIPLDLVTGFLGSGKTTLINAVLRDPAFAGTMVVVNEFGAVGLDHLLMANASDGVVLLDSGCLCCAISGTLRDTLIDLFSRRASGSLRPFDRIIVETSGLANPAPMIAALLGDTALTPRCALSQVLTLVDAANGLRTLERYQEAQRQAAFADRLLISKTDTAAHEEIHALADALAELNPHASIGRWQQNDAPSVHFTALTVRAAQAQKSGEAMPRWLRGPLRPQYGNNESGEQAAPIHSHAFEQITTHILPLPAPVSWEIYAAWTGALRARFGRRLLRCKGLLRIAPTDELWAVQGVQGYFAPPRRLVINTNPDAFLVCIGEAIIRSDLDDIIKVETALLSPMQTADTRSPTHE